MRSLSSIQILLLNGFVLFACAGFPGMVSAADHAVPSSCDIQQGFCIVRMDDGLTVQLDIQPKPVRAMTELTFIVILKEEEKPAPADAVAIDLTMPGMYMGKNMPVLREVSPGKYEGKGIFPHCISGSRTWEAEIAVRRGRTVRSAVFRFEVH